jgi:hypothetical protein
MVGGSGSPRSGRRGRSGEDRPVRPGYWLPGARSSLLRPRNRLLRARRSLLRAVASLLGPWMSLLRPECRLCPAGFVCSVRNPVPSPRDPFASAGIPAASPSDSFPPGVIRRLRGRIRSLGGVSVAFTGGFVASAIPPSPSRLDSFTPDVTRSLRRWVRSLLARSRDSTA